MAKILNIYTTLEVHTEHNKLIDRIPYRLCCSMCPRKRRHVGRHKLQKDLTIVCSFCGMNDCSIELQQGSDRG